VSGYFDTRDEHKMGENKVHAIVEGDREIL
jgi:hypothetical protein